MADFLHSFVICFEIYYFMLRPKTGELVKWNHFFCEMGKKKSLLFLHLICVLRENAIEKGKKEILLDNSKWNLDQTAFICQKRH